MARIQAPEKMRRFAAEYKTLRAFWENCPHAEWLLYLAGKLQIDHKLFVFAALDCIQQMATLIEPLDERLHQALNLTYEWCFGHVSKVEVLEAANMCSLYALRQQGAFAEVAMGVAWVGWACGRETSYSAEVLSCVNWEVASPDRVRQKISLDEIEKRLIMSPYGVG